ncbi:membrane-spanning 4-domains subfamily A member 4D-like [Solea senegalensis]|uniref:Membrane-spanning 4-domains subfamily A member 4D-like n=1 Tax=Solea senegalensis TaxID=28829 RepID=A0AAV6SP01_SOLSE|nr:membrane-spanning 4-domains subfamily A member 4D-like [Solea senegalensis]
MKNRRESLRFLDFLFPPSTLFSRYLPLSFSARRPKTRLEMEGAEPTAKQRTTGLDENQETNNTVVMSSKPLHRFVQKEPRSLGIAIMIFGFAELLMGLQLVSETVETSSQLYIPFWQGALFVLCGNLSIYTEIHPSKKMVTVCLAMYVVSLIGTIVSVGYRIACFAFFAYIKTQKMEHDWAYVRMDQLICVEGLLFTSSLCVAVLLIFLSTTARLALKSTHSQQVVVQWNPAPAQTDPASN